MSQLEPADPGYMRVLVTGSRSYTDWTTVVAVLERYRFEACGTRHAPTTLCPGHIVVVHGACPTGPDEYAAQWCRSIKTQTGYDPEEAHPAIWRTDGTSRGAYNPRAGFERNARMVALGADLCVAFIGPCIDPKHAGQARHDSHGATHCLDLAIAAGIPHRVERAQ